MNGKGDTPRPVNGERFRENFDGINWHRSPEIIFDDGPSGKCPVQAEGRIDGFPFYFRARGGHWALHVAATKDGDPLDRKTGWHHVEEYNGKVAYRDAEINDGHKFAAGWAEEDECREFITSAAAKWAAERGEK